MHGRLEHKENQVIKSKYNSEDERDETAEKLTTSTEDIAGETPTTRMLINVTSLNSLLESEASRTADLRRYQKTIKRKRYC